VEIHRVEGGSGGYLQTKFWADVIDAFNLRTATSDKLAPPTEEEFAESPIPPALLQALAVAHSGNPAGNPAGPLERFLQHTPILSRPALYGLLGAIEECVECPRPVASKLQVAVLRYLHRTSEHLTHADYFNTMKTVLCRGLKFVWEDMAGGPATPSSFCGSLFDAISLFHDMDEVDRVNAAGDNVETVADEVQQIVSESCFGFSMYKTSWVKASRVLYIRKIDQMIRQVMDHDFDDAEFQAYEKIMEASAAELHKIGHKRFDKVSSNIVVLSQPTACEVEAVDESEFRMNGVIKACQINGGYWPMLPWEALCFEKGRIDGIPVFREIAPRHLRKIKAARDAAAVMAGAGPHTVSELVKMVAGNAKDLRKLDRSMECDIQWVIQHLEDAVKQKLMAATLKILPEEGEDSPSLAKVYPSTKINKAYIIVTNRGIYITNN